MENDQNENTAPAWVISRNADGTLGDAEPLQDISIRVYSGGELLGEVTSLGEATSLHEVRRGKEVPEGNPGGKEFDLLELGRKLGELEGEGELQRQCNMQKLPGRNTARCNTGITCPADGEHECFLNYVLLGGQVLIWCDCLGPSPVGPPWDQ